MYGTTRTLEVKAPSTRALHASQRSPHGRTGSSRDDAEAHASARLGSATSLYLYAIGIPSGDVASAFVRLAYTVRSSRSAHVDTANDADSPLGE